MKLFMEVNPGLFDECSHDYTESQNNADARKQERQAKWDKISELAKQMQNGAAPPKIITHTRQGIQGPKNVTSPNTLDDIDPIVRTNDNAGRLANLKLGEEAPTFERQTSANAVR